MEDKKVDSLDWYRDKKVIYPTTIGLFAAVLISIFFLSPDCNLESETYDKVLCYIKKHSVLIVLFWGLFMAFLTNLLTGKKIRNVFVPLYNTNSRIAILIPISCKEFYQNEDLMLMLEGFGKGFSDFAGDINSKLSEHYEIVFIDSNSPELALKKVKEEIEFGTKYFISTLSSFSTELSSQFESLSKDAVLINTISGTTAIQEIENRIYNFYPNSVAEIEAIIDCIISKGLSKPYIYNFKSKFTQECRDYFISKWNTLKSADNHINKKENSFEFTNRRNFDLEHSKFLNNRVQNADVLLIFGYGNSAYDLLNVLKTKKANSLVVPNLKDKFIYTLSTFKYRDWEKEEKETVQGLKVVTVRPKMEDDKLFDTNKDVVRYFTEQTLDRLLNTIELINTQNMNFNEAWKEKSPNRLKYDNLGKVQVETREL